MVQEAMLGYQDLIVIFLIVLLLFGGSKIPELARGLGKGIREFKDAKDGAESGKEDVKDNVKDNAKKIDDPGQKTNKS